MVLYGSLSSYSAWTILHHGFRGIWMVILRRLVVLFCASPTNYSMITLQYCYTFHCWYVFFFVLCPHISLGIACDLSIVNFLRPKNNNKKSQMKNGVRHHSTSHTLLHQAAEYRGCWVSKKYCFTSHADLIYSSQVFRPNVSSDIFGWLFFLSLHHPPLALSLTIILFFLYFIIIIAVVFHVICALYSTFSSMSFHTLHTHPLARHYYLFIAFVYTVVRIVCCWYPRFSPLIRLILFLHSCHSHADHLGVVDITAAVCCRWSLYYIALFTVNLNGISTQYMWYGEVCNADRCIVAHFFLQPSHPMDFQRGKKAIRFVYLLFASSRSHTLFGYIQFNHLHFFVHIAYLNWSEM